MSEMKRKAKIIGINGRFIHSCLAIFYVRNELEKKYQELDMELIQFTINDNYYEILLKLSEGKPEYIFFSTVIWNSSLMQRLIYDLKRCLPSCRIVIGGPQASSLDALLPEGLCTIVYGEIEAVEDVFFTDLKNGTVAARYGKSFFRMEEPRFEYPYRDSDFESLLKNRHIYYESSKGCPFHCTYCLSSAEKGVYHKDLETVRNELRHVLSHRPKIVRFIDRTFNDNPQRALSIWKLLVEEGGDTLFHFEMAPDRFNDEMFDFLSSLDCGKFQFEIGIQSTNSKTLETVKRKVDLGKMRRALRRLAGFGNIHLHVDLILGLPYETKESFAQSFRDVFNLGAHYIQMGILKILPDTPISKQVQDFEYVYSYEPPYSILQNTWMDHPTVSELYWFSECVEKFVNNRYFVSFWEYLRSRNEDIFEFFMELLAVCQESGFFQLAPTQEMLCEHLVKKIAKRKDNSFLVEMLRYDWLRCNHRFLPDCLLVEGDMEQPQQTRSSLYQSLPPDMEGVYRKGNRNQFFRKAFFLRISKQMADYLDLSRNSDNPCLCFTAEREGGLYNLNKVLIF